MKTERHLYVVYDVKDDATRTRLARSLAHYGLHRVQYSVFDGIVKFEDKNSILDEIRGMDLGSEDKVHIIDLCELCVKSVTIIGKKPEVREHMIL